MVEGEFPISEAAFGQFLAVLQAMKPGLVVSDRFQWDGLPTAVLDVAAPHPMGPAELARLSAAALTARERRMVAPFGPSGDEIGGVVEFSGDLESSAEGFDVRAQDRD